jgi:hypothetical protein
MTRPENWIKWDLDSRAGIKMAAYFSDFGAAGYGLFMFFTESLYRAKGHKLGLSDGEYKAYASACKMPVEEIKRMLEALFGYKLFSSDGATFWSDRVFEELDAKEAKEEERRLQKSEAGRRGAEARWGARVEHDGSAMAEDGTAMAEDGRECQGLTKMARGEERRVDKRRLEERRDREAAGAAQSPKSPPGYREGSRQFGEYKHVWLLDEEYQELCSRFSKVQVDAKITSLDANLENKLRKYTSFKNHAACIRSWCSSDRSAGRLPREEPLPEGYVRIAKGAVRAPNGKTYQESFLRNINFMLEEAHN